MATQPSYKVVKAARVIDALGTSPIENGGVLVEGSRILRVGRVGDLTPPEGAPVEELEFPTGTLMPGLIDVHCHFNYFGDGTHTDDVMALSDDTLLMRSLLTARKHLESGVTTARETGAKHGTAFSLREGINLGLTEGPRILPCGNPITITGGHMWQMGAEADGVDEVRKTVRRMLKEGADWIKVPVTGGSSKTSFPYRPSYTLEELTALCEEAHNFGKLVGAHSRLTKTIVRSLDAGVDMIIHGGFQEEDESWVFRREVAERVARQGMTINTTIHMGRARQMMLSSATNPEDRALDYGDPKGALEKLDRDFESRMGQVRQMIDIGVKLIPGTDAGFNWYPFGAFGYELECLVMAGYSPVRAIEAATRQASEAIGVSDIVGTLEPGKESDLLVVEGNAAEDIKALHNIQAVLKGGRRVR